jgi:hypothetical protein
MADDNGVITIMQALEKMATKERLPQDITDREIYEFLEGAIPQKDIFAAIHLKIVFCADCGHVTGGNAEECESCHDWRHAFPHP